jgi:hypothetical protein
MKHIITFEQFINESYVNPLHEIDWSSSPSKPIPFEDEIKSIVEKQIKFTPESKNIIKEFRLKSDIEIDGYHFRDNTGGVTVNYKLKSFGIRQAATTLQISISVRSGKSTPVITINAWSGVGASLIQKYKSMIINVPVQISSMDELTVDKIKTIIKKVTEVSNRFLNDHIKAWGVRTSAERDFYKGRGLGSGVGNQL